MFWYSKNGQESFFFFMCFLIQSWSRQKYGGWSWTDSMTRKKKDTHLCFHYKKVSRGTTKKTQKNIVTNIQWTFLQWDIYRCHVTGNVDVILQSEVDQIDKKLTQSFPIIPSELGSVLLRKQNTEEEPTITLCINVMTACWWYVRFCSGTRSSS